MVFFGSQNGTVYALNIHNGNPIWTYHAAGAVKASPTLSGGVLYFGDYSGHVQAISEQTGRRLWISGSEGALLGSGTFYSTAAVIYGRVFLGNTDGRVYAYDASTGRLDWAVQTGGYVYASPAVVNAPGLGPTIYIGSYSGTFYALNARSGAVAWKFNAHGRISGSATIIGRTVYFSDLGQHRTYGLGISTGRVLFELRTGAFDPAISDGRDLFLTGYTGLYAFTPYAESLQAAQSPSTRQREAGRDAQLSRSIRGHVRPPPGRFRHAAAAGGERPVPRKPHPHEEPPRRSGAQREGVVPERCQPSGAFQQRRRIAHRIHGPVPASEHRAQVRQPAADQPALLGARRIERGVGERDVAHRLFVQPASSTPPRSARGRAARRRTSRRAASPSRARARPSAPSARPPSASA